MPCGPPLSVATRWREVWKSAAIAGFPLEPQTGLPAWCGQAPLIGVRDRTAVRLLILSVRLGEIVPLFPAMSRCRLTFEASWGDRFRPATTMKEAVRKLLERVRRRQRGVTHSELPSGGPSELPPTTGLTGLTVFDDVALRLRNLTVEQLDASFGDPGALPGAFKIRLARSRGFTEDAGTLIERRYSRRGYQTSGVPADANLFTFVAYDEGKLTGTVSIRLDSDRGLSADSLYKEEIDEIRAAGCKVCEFTRLAIDEKTISKPVLAGLFHTAYLYAYRVRGVDFAVIEVNPRHVVFYQRALGFEPIGEERMNERVQAPAVLLCVPFDAIAEGLQKYAGNPGLPGGSRSLFAFGFEAKDERGILKRLTALEEADRKRKGR